LDCVRDYNERRWDLNGEDTILCYRKEGVLLNEMGEVANLLSQRIEAERKAVD
jgi:hypothetical protein